MKNKIIAYSSILTYLLVIILLLTFNPDPHHDGILLSVGQLTHRGLIPHLDYVFIWGPVLPYILSIPLFIAENLIVLRVFGYLCICVIAFSLYKLNSKQISKQDSILISTVWLISLPPITVLTNNPWPRSINAWPNTYAFLFILASAYILLKISPNSIGVKTVLLNFIAGIFSVIPVLIRFNFIFCLLAILFYKYWTSKSKKAFIGFALPALSILALLIFNRSQPFVSAWFEQTFLALKGPTVSSGVPDFTLITFARSLFAITLLFFLYVMFVVIMHMKNNFISKKFLFAFIGAYILYILVSFLNDLRIIESNSIEKMTVWFNKVNSEFSLGYISVSLIALIPITIINFKNHNFDRNSDPYLILLALLAFATLPLNHNMNVEYIWLNCIFLISYSLISINKIFQISLFNLVFPSFIFSFLMLIFGLVNLSQAQVYRFQSPPLKFMHSVDKEFGADLDREMGLFKIVPSGSRFQNLCNDWIYLVNDRKLIYSSKLLTLNENPIFNKNYNIKSGTWVFECNVLDNKLDQLSKVDSYHITKSNGRISVIYKVKS
jgi:hypothetical protein